MRQHNLLQPLKGFAANFQKNEIAQQLHVVEYRTIIRVWNPSLFEII